MTRAPFVAGWLLAAAFLGLAPARGDAVLDAETKTPYQLQVFLQVSNNRVFTPLFQEQLERDLGNQLRLLFGKLARVDVARTHPLLGAIEAKGLDAALEGYDALSPRTTQFVQLDYAAGAYEIRARAHDGHTGQAGAPARLQTHDRADLARAIARLIETSFSPVGTVSASGKNVTLTLKGGELGVPLDRWVRKGSVFAVSRIGAEGGRQKAQRLEWALLEVLDAPAAGVCRCRYWHRYQEDALGEGAGALGHRAVLLPTAAAPVRVQLLDDATLKPLADVRVRVQPPGAGKPMELITNRDGLAVTRGDFQNLALVHVLSGDTVRAQFPVEVIPGRTAIARVKVQADGESLAPFQTRAGAWLRRVYENRQLSADRARNLSAQLHTSLEAALEAGRKGLPIMEGELTYLDAERKQLTKLAKDKGWAFDPREGDREIAELRKRAEQLKAFIGRIEGVLKEAGDQKTQGLVQMMERARLLEAETEFDQAIRLYDQILQASPGEKKVQAHLKKLRDDWAVANEKHAQARAFLIQTWPTLEVNALDANVARAQEALAICKAAGDRLTPLKLLRANVAHTANLKRQLDTLKRRDTEDNRNQAKTLARVGEALIRLHQDASAWIGAGKE